jgi:hypothetical protein
MVYYLTVEVSRGAEPLPDVCVTKARPPLTGPHALGNKEYSCRGGKTRKVHRKRHYQSTWVKCLNYSGPLPTIQECNDSTLCYQRHMAGGPTPECVRHP